MSEVNDKAVKGPLTAPNKTLRHAAD